MTRVYVEAKVEGDKWAGVITDKGVISDSEFFKLCGYNPIYRDFTKVNTLPFVLTAKQAKEIVVQPGRYIRVYQNLERGSGYRFFIPPAWPRWEIN